MYAVLIAPLSNAIAISQLMNERRRDQWTTKNINNIRSPTCEELQVGVMGITALADSPARPITHC